MGCFGETKKPSSFRARLYAESYEPLREYVALEFSIPEEMEVTVYRREVEGFIFDYHAKEFFDGMSPDENDVIYRGKLTPVYSFAEYKDYDIEIGKIYAYWVATDKERKTGPAPVKIRDSRVWWHFDKIMKEMQDLKDKYPDVELISVGETVEHRPLVTILAGNRENMIGCMGNVHAGESGAEICLTTLRYILENHPDLLQKTGIAVLPSVNADMREEMATGAPWYLRINKNYVDINRNFSVDWDEVTHGYGISSDDPRSVTYRGRYPESEPETKAIMKFAELINPKIILSYHALCSVTCDNMLTARAFLEDEVRNGEVEGMFRAYSDAFRKGMDMPPREGKILNPGCFPGGFVRWAQTKGICAADLELSLGGNLDYFDTSRKDKTDFEMLDKNIGMHRNGIIALMEHLM